MQINNKSFFPNLYLSFNFNSNGDCTNVYMRKISFNNSFNWVCFLTINLAPVNLGLLFSAS